jgi:hypothetical protein
MRLSTNVSAPGSGRGAVDGLPDAQAKVEVDEGMDAARDPVAA